MEKQRNFEGLIATQYNDNGKFGKLLQFSLVPLFYIIIIDPMLIFLYQTR